MQNIDVLLKNLLKKNVYKNKNKNLIIDCKTERKAKEMFCLLRIRIEWFEITRQHFYVWQVSNLVQSGLNSGFILNESLFKSHNNCLLIELQ